MRPHPEFGTFFVATWAILMIAGLWLNFIDRNIARKKRLLPVFIVGAGVLFAVFASLIIADLRVITFFIVPAIVLVTFLNLRLTRVCSSCGRTVINGGSWLEIPKYCPRCGAKLD